MATSPIILFSEGLAAVQVDGKWGFIDRTGSMVIPPQFPDYEGPDYVFKNGDIRFSPRVVGVSPFSEGLAGLQIGGKWGFIDKTGAVVINPQFPALASSGFHDGLAFVYIGGRYGFIDKAGAMVINPQFELRPWQGDEGFSEGLFYGNIDGKWVFIDRTGAVAINSQFEFAQRFSEGLAAVRVGGKWGFE